MRGGWARRRRDMVFARSDATAEYFSSRGLKWNGGVGHRMVAKQMA